MGAGKFYKYKRKSARKKKSNTTKINSLVRKVALNAPEVKELYKTRPDAASVVGPITITLNGLRKGVNNAQRIGNKIRLKSLVFNLNARCLDANEKTGTETSTPWTLTATQSEMRVILYMNKINNQSNLVTTGEVLRFSGSTRDQLVSVYNKSFVGWKLKYKILYDRHFMINNMGNGRGIISIRKMVPLKNIINYNGDIGDASDIIDNDLRVKIISSSTDMEYSWTTCLRYTDA